MAKRTRKSSKNLVVKVGGIAVGIGVGALAVPKLITMVDKNGTLDPKIASGVGAVAAFLGARATKDTVQDVLIGVAAGQAWNLVSSIVGVSGIGEDFNASTDLNRVAGGEFGASRQGGVQM